MLYACVGIGLTGTKGGRFALITESIAAVGSSDLIDEAVSVGVETGSSCLLCATWCLARPVPVVKEQGQEVHWKVCCWVDSAICYHCFRNVVGTVRFPVPRTVMTTNGNWIFCRRSWRSLQILWKVLGFNADRQKFPNHQASKCRKFSRRYCRDHRWNLKDECTEPRKYVARFLEKGTDRF